MTEQQMMGFTAVVVVAMCLSVGVPTGRTAVTRWLRYRTIARTPRTAIGTLKPGLAEVRGRVQTPAALLSSPIKQVPCVYYDFAAREPRMRRKSGHSRMRWIARVTDRDESVCVIDDGTGSIRVPLTNADCAFRIDSTTTTGLTEAPSERLRAQAMAKLGRDGVARLFGSTLRCEEIVIRPGDELTVVGIVEPGPGGLTFAPCRLQKDDPLLIVTDRGEAWLRKRERSRALVKSIPALLSAVVLVLVVIAAGT